MGEVDPNRASKLCFCWWACGVLQLPGCVRDPAICWHAPTFNCRWAAHPRPRRWARKPAIRPDRPYAMRPPRAADGGGGTGGVVNHPAQQTDMAAAVPICGFWPFEE